VTKGLAAAPLGICRYESRKKTRKETREHVIRILSLRSLLFDFQKLFIIKNEPYEDKEFPPPETVRVPNKFE